MLCEISPTKAEHACSSAGNLTCVPLPGGCSGGPGWRSAKRAEKGCRCAHAPVAGHILTPKHFQPSHASQTWAPTLPATSTAWASARPHLPGAPLASSRSCRRDAVTAGAALLHGKDACACGMLPGCQDVHLWPPPPAADERPAPLLVRRCRCRCRVGSCPALAQGGAGLMSQIGWVKAPPSRRWGGRRLIVPSRRPT